MAAARLRREGQVLVALRTAAPHLPLPQVVAIGTDPVLIVTRLVRGGPLTGAAIAALDDAGTDRVAADLAAFLAALDDASVLEMVRPTAPMAAPELQADTDSLHRRLRRWESAKQRDTVLGLCHRVDAVLGRSRGRWSPCAAAGRTLVLGSLLPCRESRGARVVRPAP